MAHSFAPECTELRPQTMKKLLSALLSLLLAFSLLGSPAALADGITDELGLTAEVKPATDYTLEINSAVYDLLDFEDTSEYENATRGLIDAPEALEIPVIVPPGL